ncbi:MAG: LysM peptidoglycan-binding domain-containing protein [Dehalococcoidia bacterium]
MVKAGDNPGGIAQELGVDLADLLRVNGIDDPRSLRVGQQLKVPRPSPTPGRPGATAVVARTPTAAVATRTPAAATPGTATRTPTPGLTGITGTRTPTPAAATGAPGTYTVQSGDTACEIATRLGVPLAALAEANNTTPQGLAALSIGQTLRVPVTRGEPGC